MGSAQSQPSAVESVPEMVFKHVSPQGTVIAQYLMDKELGSGGFGKVYRVKEMASGQYYALKLLRGLGVAEEIAAKKEVEALKTLDHPHIVQYKSSFTLNEGRTHAFCIVMEYVEGTDLQTYLSSIKKPPPVYFVMSMFLELLITIRYLHSQRIGHRDIKPENIILVKGAPRGNLIKLVDFGLARELLSEQEGYDTVHNIGTRAYMAPEHFTRQFGRPGLKADVWALGLVLYQSLTLDAQFRGMVAGWATAISCDPYLLSRNVPDSGLRELLQKMLELVPARCSSDELFESELVQGWVRTLAGNFFPSQAGDVRALASLVHPSTPMIFSIMETVRDNSRNIDFCQWFLLSNGVERLCQLFEHQAAQSTVHSRGGTVMMNVKALKQTDIIQSILAFYRQGYTVSAAATAQVYSSGALLAFFQELKQYPLDSFMLDLFRAIVQFPSVEQELSQMGLPYVLKGMFDRHPEASLSLFCALNTVRDLELVSLFLRHAILQDDSREHLVKLLRGHGWAHDLITRSNSQLWSELIGKCLSSQADKELELVSLLLHLILPMQEIIKHETRSSCCDRGVLGSAPVRRLVYVCISCDDKTMRCLACARRCHPQCALHRPGYGVCECACDEQEECAFPCFPQEPRLCNNFAPVTHSYHAMKDVLVDSSGTFKIPLQPGFSQPMILQDLSCPIGNISDGEGHTIQFYFELKFLRSQQLCMSNGGLAAVGLTSSVYGNDAYTDHMLGKSSGEVGYQASNGRIWLDHQAVDCGPHYSCGEVVGCGVTADRRIFYTVNGVFVGFIQSKWNANLAVASFCSWGSGVEVQFEYTHFKYTSAPLEWRINRFALQVFRQHEEALADCLERVAMEEGSRPVIGTFKFLLQYSTPLQTRPSITDCTVPKRLKELFSSRTNPGQGK